MKYYEIQQEVYQNKINRNFNILDIGKEITLMTEEFGELCDAYIKNDAPEIKDAIGDLMIYCLGLAALFKQNSDEITNNKIDLPENPNSLKDYLPYVGREIGMMAKTYKKSNRKPINKIDKKEIFIAHTGNLIAYLSSMFKFIGADENSELKKIIDNNKIRTHAAKI